VVRPRSTWMRARPWRRYDPGRPSIDEKELCPDQGRDCSYLKDDCDPAGLVDSGDTMKGTRSSYDGAVVPETLRMLARRTPPTVLLYHGFGEHPSDVDVHDLFLPPAALRKQLRVLSRWYRPLDLTSYLAGYTTGRWPRRSVLVTIDDGFRSTLTEAAPWFARYKVPAVLFVPGGCIGGTSTWIPEFPDEPILDAGELRLMQQQGIEIGVHGFDHSNLLGMAPEQLARNIVLARELLADVLGVDPTAYAYPYGAFDEKAVAALDLAGYAVGFAVDQGGGRFTIRRTVVNSYDSTAIVLMKALPLWELAATLLASTPRVRRAAARLAGRRPFGATS
jgi:peptidoglycan/xylan/chitin deacetylase (PgdA/CDA1 family)